MVGFISALLDARKRFGGGRGTGDGAPRFHGSLRGDSENREGDEALLFKGVKRLGAR